MFLLLTAAPSGRFSIPKADFRELISTPETPEHTDRPPDGAGIKVGVSSDSYEARGEKHQAPFPTKWQP